MEVRIRTVGLALLAAVLWPPVVAAQVVVIPGVNFDFMVDGSAARPSSTYINDRDTGLYRVGADNLGITAGGTLRADINTSRLRLAVDLDFTTDNTDDVGASANRPRTLYAGTSIELGHATDTTLTRVSAGLAAVEGVNIPGISGTPANNQCAIWTSATALEGTAGCTDDGTTFGLARLVSVTTFGSHSFSAGGSGVNLFTVRNTTAGVANAAGINVGNDAAADLFVMRAFSSTFTTSGSEIQASARLASNGAGGLILVAEHASGDIRFYAGGTTEVGRIDSTQFLWGDTANANNTAGVTINQGIVDNQIQTFKSTTDVVTGATTLPLSPFDLETDDYFACGKASALTGGLYCVGIAESTVSEAAHLEFWGGAPDTTDTATSLAAVNWFVGQHDGANADADMAVNSNAFAWGEIDSAGARQTRMVLKADDGELHLGNTTLVALDDHDDAAIMRGLQRVLTADRGVELSPFEPSVIYDYNELHRLGFIGERDAQGDFLIRVQPILGGLLSATVQSYFSQRELATRLTTVEDELRAELRAVRAELARLKGPLYATQTFDPGAWWLPAAGRIE